MMHQSSFPREVFIYSFFTDTYGFFTEWIIFLEKVAKLEPGIDGWEVIYLNSSMEKIGIIGI